MTDRPTRANLSTLRDYAVHRLQDADIEFDPTAVGRVINDYYESSDLIRNQNFIHDNVLFHAGIAFRVSDNPEGERFGLQIVRGNVNKQPEDNIPVDPYIQPRITHKMDYDMNKCARKPLRETHYFLTIDTHITYRKGKTEAQYEYVGDNDDVRGVLTQLQHILEFMFRSPEGRAIWIVPVRSQTWGVTVDNLLRTQGVNALIPYHGTMEDITRIKGANINRRYKAISVVEKDNYAFRLPKTCEINQEQEEAKANNPQEWFNRNIYSFQYATKIGVRKRYDQDHVLTYMANTHIIIKHYDRLQIDLDAFRKTVNEVIRPYYQKLNIRLKNKRPYLEGYGKSVYLRYTMRDNSLIHDFLLAYIEKAKAEASVNPEVNDARNDLDELDIPDTDPQVYNREASPEPIVYIDVGMDAEDIEIEREFGEPYVQIGKIFLNSNILI